MKGTFGGQKGKLRLRYNGHQINHFFHYFAGRQNQRNNVTYELRAEVICITEKMIS